MEPAAKGDLWNLAAVCIPPRRVRYELTKKTNGLHALCSLCVRMRVMRVMIYAQMTFGLHFFAKTFCIPFSSVIKSLPWNQIFRTVEHWPIIPPRTARGTLNSSIVNRQSLHPEGDYRGGGGYLAALLHLYRPTPYLCPYHCGMETGWPQWSQIPRGRNSPCSLAGCQYSPSAHGGSPGAGGSAPVVIYELRFTRYEFGNNGSRSGCGGIKKPRGCRGELRGGWRTVIRCF